MTRSPKKAKMPAKMTAITISCVSRLRMWVSSCASTASSSSSRKRVDEAAGHSDDVLAFAQAGGVGVERRRLDDLQRRHRQPARDAQVLQHVVELGRLGCASRPWRRWPCRSGSGARNRRSTNQASAAIMAIGQERRELPQRRRPTISSNVPPRNALQISRSENSRACSSAHEPGQQQRRAQPVRLDVSVEAVGLEHRLLPPSEDRRPHPLAYRIVSPSWPATSWAGMWPTRG